MICTSVQYLLVSIRGSYLFTFDFKYYDAFPTHHGIRLIRLKHANRIIQIVLSSVRDTALKQINFNHELRDTNLFAIPRRREVVRKECTEVLLELQLLIGAIPSQ